MQKFVKGLVLNQVLLPLPPPCSTGSATSRRHSELPSGQSQLRLFVDAMHFHTTQGSQTINCHYYNSTDVILYKIKLYQLNKQK